MPLPSEERTIPCVVCGYGTYMRSTGLCHGCWEVDRRLEEFLRYPEGRCRVRAALEQAEAKEGEDPG